MDTQIKSRAGSAGQSAKKETKPARLTTSDVAGELQDTGVASEPTTITPSIHRFSD